MQERCVFQVWRALLCQHLLVLRLSSKMPDIKHLREAIFSRKAHAPMNLMTVLNLPERGGKRALSCQCRCARLRLEEHRRLAFWTSTLPFETMCTFLR